MPLQSTSCPKCGKEASEYAEGKWRCLHCGLKFIYEKPQDIVVQKHYHMGHPVSEEEPYEDHREYSISEEKPKSGCLTIFLAFLLISIIIGAIVKVREYQDSQKPRLKNSESWSKHLEEQDKIKNVVKEKQTEPKIDEPIEHTFIEPVYNETRSIFSQDFEDKPKDIVVETRPVEPKPVEPKPELTEPDPIIEQANKRARSKLGLARSYLAANHIEKARKILVSIIKDYPETKSAELAKKLLNSPDC